MHLSQLRGVADVGTGIAAILFAVAALRSAKGHHAPMTNRLIFSLILLDVVFTGLAQDAAGVWDEVFFWASGVCFGVILGLFMTQFWLRDRPGARAG